MKFLKKHFGNNLLLKVTSFNSIGVLVKIITGFITQKALAIFVGPQGVGFVGNFRDFIAVIQTFSTIGLSNAIIKYVSEFKENKNKLSQILSTSLGISLIAASFCAVIIFFTASYWNEKFFSGIYDFTLIIEVSAIAIPVYALNTMLVSVINGYSKYRLFVLVNICSNILVLAVTLFLLWQFRLEGALYSIVIAPVVSFIISILFVFHKRSKAKLFSFSLFNFQTLKNFKTFVLMALLSGIAMPFVRIAIRDYIEITDGKNAVGYWEAMFRISSFYLMFFTSLMTLYVLPKLSQINNNKDFRSEIANFYKTLLPLFAATLFIFYLLRNYVILILQTEEFYPMEPLFAWQLLGDFFKVASMVIAYQFIAKNMFWHYVFVEIFAMTALYSLCIIFISQYGFVGASMAYALQSFLHLLLVFIIFRKKLFSFGNT